MALKQKTNFTQDIMGGVRKNIEVSQDAIQNGVPADNILESQPKPTTKKVGKDSSSERIIKKSVFFDFDVNDKLETIKQWRRFKDGMKRVSVDDIIYEATCDWLDRNFEAMKKRYEG
ncbi:MAG: hypothetical protein Q4A15_11710 [Prevotellaceae bacterium]|nr:hypothetical protein [Prevotellaceae bacterium]